MKIDPTYLNDLSAMSFRIKRKMFDKYVGNDTAKSLGDGQTFKDHSPYTMGDDVRKIDWKAYARTGEIFVKRYEADRNVTMHALIDASSSMDYGNQDEHKFTYSAKIALALAYVMNKHQGRVRFATFADKLHDAHTIAGSASLQSMLQALEKTTIGGHTNLIDSLQGYKAKVLKTKSTLLIFSDFLVDFSQIKDMFTMFPKSNVILVHVVHDDELQLAYEGDFKLRDLESNEELRVHISPRFVAKYKERYVNHIKQISYSATAARMKFVTISTKDAIVVNFMKLWEKI